MATKIKTAQVNVKKAVPTVQTPVSEDQGYLTNALIRRVRNIVDDSDFVSAFQSAVSISVENITLAQLKEAFEDTQEQFEQAPVDERSVKSIVKSIALGDSGLMKPVTVTEYDGLLYITGGRHRTQAIIYIMEDVLELDDENEVTVLYQVVEEYHQLVELIEADNAGRRMRGAELSIIQSQLLGVTKEHSMEEALEHLFSQKKVTRSQLRKAVNAVVVRENRRNEDSPITDEGARTLVNYLTASLFAYEYDATAYALALASYYEYIIKNYNKLAKLVNAEYGDENVIRHAKWVFEQIYATLKLDKQLGKLRTQSDAKAEVKAEAEAAREAKALAKAKAEEKKSEPATEKKARKVAKPVEVEVEVDEDEEEEVQPAKTAKRKAGQKVAKPAVVEVDEDDDEDEVIQEETKPTTRKATKIGKFRTV